MKSNSFFKFTIITAFYLLNAFNGYSQNAKTDNQYSIFNVGHYSCINSSEKNKPKQNDSAYSKACKGDVTLTIKTAATNSGDKKSEEILETLNTLPGDNEKITANKISSIEVLIDGDVNLKSIKEISVAYFFYQSGKTKIAVPYLIFDLPQSDVPFKMYPVNFKMAAFKKSNHPNPVLTKIDKNQSELTYETTVAGKQVQVKLKLIIVDFTYGNNGDAENHWCGVRTDCGPSFAVSVPDTTPCGSVSTFFNKVCNGLLAN